MNDIVEMYRDAAERGGRDRFSCSVPIWELLQEVAQTFGWVPVGASYVAPPKLTVEAPARHDYRPGGARDVKRVEKVDAAAWAGALQSAQDSPHLAAMIAARADAIATADGRAAEALRPGVIEEFVEFAYGGAFTFALSSAA